MQTRMAVFSLMVLTLAACGGGSSSSSSGIASIVLAPPSASIAVGGTVQITATAKDAAGNILSGVNFTWTSSAMSIASVDSSGLVTGLAAGSTNITASSGGVSSSATALTVTANTGVAYYIPYSVLMGAQQTPIGLYLVSAADPSATPITATSAALDTAQFAGNGYTTLYSWTYDATTQQATGPQPALEVYGSAGHLYQVSLTNPTAGPQQLSSGSYTTLCGIFNAQEGPYGGSAPQYIQVTIDTVAGDNCNTTADEQMWVIAAGTGATTAPTQLPTSSVVVAVLWDASTGLVTGYLIQSGAELDLYDTHFIEEKSLLAGLGANYPFAIGELNGNALVDEETFNSTSSPMTSSDALYLVNASSATLIATYSTNSTNPYFTSAACSSNSNAFNQFIWGQDAGNKFVFSYPDVGGNLNIYTLPATGGTPTAIYTAGGVCLNSFDGASSDHLALHVASGTSANSGDESIALAGPVSQTPIPLAGFGSSATGGIQYMTGNIAWIFPVSGFTQTAVDITTGNVIKSFPNTMVYKDVWGGYDSTQGILRSTIILAEVAPTGTCSAPAGGVLVDGLETVDTSTFAVTTVPTQSGFSACASTSDAAGPFFGPGPVLMGSLAAQGGSYGVASLVVSTSSPQVNLNLATAPTGATTNGSAFINLLQSANLYFGY